MPALPPINRLASSLKAGLPPHLAARLAQSSGMHTSAIQRLVALWLQGHLDAERDALVATRRVGFVGVVAPGNLFIATWQLIVEVLSLGGRVRVRASSRDRAAIDVLHELMLAIDTNWANSIEICQFSRDDDAAWGRFAEGLDAMVAQGSDETMEALQSRFARLRPGMPTRRHGHRLSWMWIDEVDPPEAIAANAAAMAHDTLLADGRGCMAPRAALIAGGLETLEPIVEVLLTALTQAAERLPPGQLPEGITAQHRAWVEQARFDAALDGRPFHATLDHGFGLVVIGGPPPDTLPLRDLGPGGRLLVVRPAPASQVGLSSVLAYTSTIGLCATRPTPESGRLRMIFRDAGVGRVCAVGRMQAPPWSVTSDGDPLGDQISTKRGDVTV